jgi:hypothetical protein
MQSLVTVWCWLGCFLQPCSVITAYGSNNKILIHFCILVDFSLELGSEGKEQSDNKYNQKQRKIIIFVNNEQKRS